VAEHRHKTLSSDPVPKNKKCSQLSNKKIIQLKIGKGLEQAISPKKIHKGLMIYEEMFSIISH
jgi:hypothetical protein